jgi:excisionase family DNA binding protein
MSKDTKSELTKYSDILNKKEASKYLGVSIRHIDNLINRRSIPFSRLGGRIVFQKKRLIQYLDSTDSLGGMLNV